MILRTFFLTAALAAPPLAAQTGEEVEKPKSRYAQEIAKRYQLALDHFSGGRYSQAILEWTEILRKDPEQGSAEKMIRMAREQIDKRDKAEQKEVFDLAGQGRYQDSFIALQVLLERDPQHPVYSTLERRIDRVSEIVVRAPGGSAWRAAVKGLTGYIALEDDLQLAYNGLRYAAEFDPADGRFEKLTKLVLAERPALAQDEVTSGMKILDYKRFVGLNHIYDGKYNLAIRNLRQVLQLEGNDVVALKRIGSAYFALKRFRDAEEAWTQAIKLSPTDEELHQFLERAAARARSAAAEQPPPAKVDTAPAEEASESLEEEEEAADPGVKVFRPRSSNQ